MKISNRIQVINTEKAAEKEAPLQSNKLPAQDKGQYEGPNSIQRDQVETRRDKFESFGRLPQIDSSAIPESVQDLIENRNSLASEILDFLDTSPAQNEPRIDSRVEKYKGPDSIQRPEIESKVNKYEGPDSLKLPERGSRVDQYKGPKSLPQEAEIESRANKYKGPDSIKTENGPTIPAAVQDLLDNQNSLAAKIREKFTGSSDRKEGSTATQTSTVASPVEKYKGPDSIQTPEIESKAEKNKLPDSIAAASDSDSKIALKSGEKSSTKDAMVRMQIENRLGNVNAPGIKGKLEE